MPTSKQADSKLPIPAKKIHKLLGQEHKKENEQPDPAQATLRQQRKRDAMDLAELIYDIFKDSLSNVKIIGDDREDVRNV